MQTLDGLSVGQKAAVVRVTGASELRRRLMDMGLTRGAQISLLRIAPMGDPLEFQVRGYHLSLRRSEARLVEVELVQAAA